MRMGMVTISALGLEGEQNLRARERVDHDLDREFRNGFGDGADASEGGAA